MTKEILQKAEESMKKTVEAFRKDLAGMRAGRASPALLDRIVVPYYGVPTPISQMASIAVPEPRMIIVQPWDKTQLGVIEKAIMKSDLGIMPATDGNVIRLVVPQLTEERRKEIIKSVGKLAEEFRVAIRSERRAVVQTIKESEKDKKITEDERDRAEEEAQKITDTYIKKVDELVSIKEKEMMEV
jgi:ribosome recycling factor